jgi:hypothetical protein
MAETQTYKKPKTPPRHVNILGLGPTWYKCPEEVPDDTEIWGANTMYRSRNCHRIFIMHDLRHDIMLMDKDFVKNANATGAPVYTAGDYPVFTNNVVFPVEKMVEEFRVAFNLNVMTYMLALAIMEDARKISLWGCDCRTDTGYEYRINEKGSMEFWIGVGVGRGIEFSLPEESYILKRVMSGGLYGYVPKVAPNGLWYAFPENIQRAHRNYKLTPLDSKGEEMPEYSVVTQLNMEDTTVIE